MGFYGNPIKRDWRESWNLLRHLSGDHNTPWLVLRDFNEITSSFEKRGGRLRSERQMLDFRMALEDCNLIDIGFKGCWFTWERGRVKATNIRERLDRGVATLNWLELFPKHQIEHLTHSFSDHCPLLLDTMGGNCIDQQLKERKFRFEAKWCLESSFEGLVRRWWEDTSESIPNKLEIMGHRLLEWSKLNTREERRNRLQLKQRLEDLHSQDISDDVLAEIVEVQLDLNLEADKEEIYWEQRARVNWLKNGDRNTSFFHKMAGQRHFRDRISELIDKNGVRYSSPEDMVKVASYYVVDLFTASEMGLDEHLFSLVDKKVTEGMNDSLLKHFTEEDVWNVVKSMPPLKAPGVDGFSATFFQRFWYIVGPEVVKFCLAVLNGEMEVGDINNTRIVLIPKVDKPKLMSQFRPISLCNVIYKIIAKVLVNRMSNILEECINEAQGAFILRRLISDNVLIAYEVLHSLKMKKSGKKGYFALKLDMMSYSVCLNSKDSDWFSPSRGLRQGDPLSPYLFLICAEGFSTLLEDAKQRGRMGGAPISREKLSINHLFFADDCILFGDATREGAKTVRDIIQEYEMCAGQKRIGKGKSVNIWNDPWLPGRENNRVSGHDIIPSYTHVSQLIDVDSNTWNKELICSIVDENTADRILSIPITDSRTEDTLVWKHDGSGVYTVKSGYRVLATSGDLNNILSSNEDDYNNFYKSLRPLNIPEKIKIHVWRLFNNLLPHRSNLVKQMLAAEYVCPLCGIELEDSNHLMWSCSILKSVWSHLHVRIPALEESWDDKQCFAQMFSTAEEQQRCIIALSLWNLWHRRNILIHEGVQFCLQDVLGFIQGYAQEIYKYQKTFQTQVRPSSKELWRPPEEGVIKLNFDATYKSNEKIATTAVVARYATGIIRGAETYLFVNVADPFVAEARACERALIFTLTMGFRRLAVEGDSLSVIKSIKKRDEDRSVLRLITQHICQMGLRFEEISYLHVRRSANEVAHTLVLEGRRKCFSGRWVNGLPDTVQRLALKDRSEGHVGF
ncbi:reverse transcriptase [Gossypium australe]|uniref:Reverse transcriptase n=1 Tax=Gossypium australe TaxID=47621 RepID=A0A5B6XAZ1_9ROSI|nr:reverse transcriptase [Gossypium australe]